MQIFKACFTPGEKARTIFRALVFARIKFASLAMALAFLSCFLKTNTFIFITEISKKTKKPFFFEFSLG